jgi:hypothetical protein
LARSNNREDIIMDTKTAREVFTKLEALNIGELNEVLWDLDCKITAAECAQEDMDAITDEERANLPDDEEFECEADLRDAMKKVETDLEEIIGKIDDQRQKLSSAEEMINNVFGYYADQEDEEVAA